MLAEGGLGVATLSCQRAQDNGRSRGRGPRGGTGASGRDEARRSLGEQAAGDGRGLRAWASADTRWLR